METDTQTSDSKRIKTLAKRLEIAFGLLMLPLMQADDAKVKLALSTACTVRTNFCTRLGSRTQYQGY